MKGEKFRAPRPLVWAIVRKHLRGMTGAEIQEVYGIPAYVTQRWLKAWRGGDAMSAIDQDFVRDLIERHSDASGGNGRDFHNGAYARMADEIEQVVAATLGPCNDSCNCTNGERTDLAAENARLRAMRDTWAENDAKLRELVRELWEGYMDPPCEDCPLKDKPACADCPICAREAAVVDRMRELGVEVDDV